MSDPYTIMYDQIVYDSINNSKDMNKHISSDIRIKPSATQMSRVADFHMICVDGDNSIEDEIKVLIDSIVLVYKSKTTVHHYFELARGVKKIEGHLYAMVGVGMFIS